MDGVLCIIGRLLVPRFPLSRFLTDVIAARPAATLGRRLTGRPIGLAALEVQTRSVAAFEIKGTRIAAPHAADVILTRHVDITAFESGRTGPPGRAAASAASAQTLAAAVAVLTRGA